MNTRSWLEAALKSSGMSQAELARQLTEHLKRSIDRAAVNKIIKGDRDLSAEEMLATSTITGYPAPKGAAHRIPLIGFVSAGAAVSLFSADDDQEFVDGPDSSTEKTVALEIRGDSMGTWFDRWIVFFDDIRRAPAADAIGQPSVVGLADGRVLIRKLQRSKTKGRYHLVSQSDDPLLDQKVTWAAKVKTITQRRG